MRMHSQDNAGGALRPDISRPIVSGRRATAGVSWANPFTRHAQKGSLILVVLCLLAVLGIALASFLAVGNQSMKLSNRSYRTSMSAQLAEMGLEEALRAFNNNDWSNWSANPTNVSSGAWTLDTTNRRATRTIQFLNGKLGQGATGTVKIRVDNYDAHQLNAAYSPSANYRAGSLVSYTDGKWYRSTTSHSGKTPSSSSGYWIQEYSSAPNSVSWMTWTNGTSYAAGSMTARNGYLYRCINPHTSSTSNKPPNATYWLDIPYATFGSDLQYYNDALVFWTNTTWYRYSGGSWYTTGTGMPPVWYYNSGTTYYSGDTVRSGTSWYRYINSTPALGHTLIENTYWETAQSLANTAAAAWNWSSTNTYNLNDVVYYSSGWYRSIAANNNGNTPSTSSAYWSASPLLSRTWDSSWQYSANDTVFYNGVCYLSRQNSNFNQNPATATGYWYSAANSTMQWNASTSYSVGSYRSYGGVWYKCLSAGSNKTPNNSSNWTASWAQSSGVTSGAPVIYAEGQVTLPDSTAVIKTQLRATIAPAPLFPNAIAATSTLVISGGGTIDSYDSVTDPSASTPGYSAVLAATSTTNPAVTVTSTTVNGYVAAPSATTSPYAPMWTSGGSAVLKGTPAGTGIDLTRVSRSPYIPKFDIRAVAGAIDLELVNNATNTIGTPGATTPTVYNLTRFGVNQLYLNTSTDLLIIQGPVIINISSGFLISSGKMIITSTGSAEIHFGGDLAISGSNGIDNQTLDPKKLIIMSNATTGTYSYTASTSFYGCIYLPNATNALTVGSGQIYGALSAKNITFSGAANLHYDTSLRYAIIPGLDQPYAISEWRELTDPNERAVLP